MKQIVITMLDDESGVHVAMTDTDIEGGFIKATKALSMLKCAREGVEDVEDELIKNAVSAFGSEESEGVVELKKLLKETR